MTRLHMGMRMKALVLGVTLWSQGPRISLTVSKRCHTYQELVSEMAVAQGTHLVTVTSVNSMTLETDRRKEEKPICWSLSSGCHNNIP